MTSYTTLFVACSHCKEAAWSMLPYAPGVIPLELGHQVLDFNRPDGWYFYAASLVLSASAVAWLAWLVNLSSVWLKIVAVSIALFIFSFCAYVLLALIRA
jgi:hypothetical protein